MVALLPKLFILVFVVIIIWVAWQIIKKINPSMAAAAHDDDIDALTQAVEYESDKANKINNLKTKAKKLKKGKTKKTLNEIRDLLE